MPHNRGMNRGTAPLSSRVPALRLALAGWLLAATMAVIVYASFYPFDFSWARIARADAGQWPSGLPWIKPSRGDVIANLIFYIPFGALLTLLAPTHWGVLRRLAVAVLIGTLFSALVEYLQYGAQTRVPSATDLVLNSASTLGGALCYIALKHAVQLPRLRDSATLPVILLLLATWLGFHAAPFMPRLSLYQVAQALAPVTTLEFSVASTGKFFAGYVILGTAVRALVQREYFWRVFTLVVGLSLLCRVVFVGQQMPLGEPLGLLLALPLIVVFRDQPYQRAALPLAFLAVLGWHVYGLAPFNFDTAAREFHWLPFAGFMDATRENGYLSFLDKSYLYLGLVWLTTTSGAPLLASTLTLASLGLGIEFAQRYLPGRHAELTDPLLIVAAASVLAIANNVWRAREASS
jgi:VanZ family protein